MKRKIRFNLLDAAIILVVAALVLSFVFREEIVSFVPGASAADFSVTVTLVTPEDSVDRIAVDAPIEDTAQNPAGRITGVTEAEGYTLPEGQRAVVLTAEIEGYVRDGKQYLSDGTCIAAGETVYIYIDSIRVSAHIDEISGR